jgi:hypothetical protein
MSTTATTVSTSADGDDEGLGLYPAWREALKHWPSAGFTWGDTIPHEWFYEAFELQPVVDTMTVRQAEAIRLKFLGQFESFRRALLEEHRMDLANVRGYGYEIVTPAEASRRAFDDGIAEIKKALRTMARRLIFVPTGQLTDEQRRENADLMARSSTLRRMFGFKRDALPGEIDGD